MTTFFDGLTHLLILAALIGELGLIGYAIATAHGTPEKLLRITALSIALLAFFAARGLGISLAAIFGEALQLSSPIRFGLANVLFPAVLGTAVTLYFTSRLRKADDITTRVMIMVGAFIVFQFGDVYALAFKLEGLELDRAFTANIVFTLAVGICAVLRVETR